MMILPVLVLFMVLQRRFIAGLTQGGVNVSVTTREDEPCRCSEAETLLRPGAS